MSTRAYVQLAHVYKPSAGFDGIKNWLASEKFDGMRAIWDGGVTKGMFTDDIPYANTRKDKKRWHATGLWSRHGKPIFAPQWWLRYLPTEPLDGELWSPTLSFQEIMSTVKKSAELDPRWDQIHYMVFDRPDFNEFLKPGEIYLGAGEERWKISEHALLWWRSLSSHAPNVSDYFHERHKHLIRMEYQNEVVRIADQIRVFSKDVLDGYMDVIYKRGGEGVVVRAPNSPWTAKRSHDLLKIKPFLDSEAVVVGFTSGRSRLGGLLGALKVKWNNVEFEIGGGLTDGMRMLDSEGHPIYFQRGMKVNFRYRALTLDGIPKEARYLRTVD